MGISREQKSFFFQQVGKKTL